MVREALTPERLQALEPAEAAAVLVSRRAEGLTASETSLLADWLAADEAHQRAFDGAVRAWEQFESGADDELLAAMRAHALKPRARSFTGWPVVAAAAALLLMIAAGVLVMQRPSLAPPSTPGQQAPAAIEYASARGEVKELALPDGSAMTLDADSAVRARFGATGRDIELVRGRAYFSVAHDAAKPFAVAAAGHRVVAVGTRFDVGLSAGAVTVTLLEGRVTVGAPGGAVLTLEPGQQFQARGGAAGSVRALGAQADGATGWRRGLMSFDDEPLSEAVGEVNRYAGDQIVIRDPAVASLRVSGQFKTGEAQRFADTIAEIHPVRAVRRGQTIELVSAR